MIRLPPALVPLRNSTFRRLWLASVVAWLGTWLQNTGADWLMTTLAPRPLIVRRMLGVWSGGKFFSLGVQPRGDE
jgi:hypothetical protein